MRKIIIDVGDLADPAEIQRYLAARFSFPEYYGMNLDALYDELTSLTEDTCVGVFEAEDGPAEGYMDRLCQVMRDAEEENPHLSVVFGRLERNLDY